MASYENTDSTGLFTVITKAYFDTAAKILGGLSLNTPSKRIIVGLALGYLVQYYAQPKISYYILGAGTNYRKIPKTWRLSPSASQYDGKDYHEYTTWWPWWMWPMTSAFFLGVLH